MTGSPPTANFLGKWVLANSVAFALFPFTLGIGFGALLGLVQWMVLRRYLSISAWWILASALGVLAGIPLFAVLLFLVSMSVSVVGVDFLLYPALGAILGYTQSTMLRRFHVNSGRWIAASAAGTVFSFLGLGVMSGAFATGNSLATALIIPAFAVSGIAYAIPTGWVMRRLIRQERSVAGT